ncbi:hypothetical protein GZ998_02655 [Actinomyces sp. 594]|uniref:hypothetical protein n=1 Tax=Actinomyces sp. 594 TaxID=2057793 RepID=UPI001C55D138|nr:hypothetical protein [Actinomyces sp. 594]MBW3068415.1 hypothetical protein [Actinomyces sp. 594]
MSNAVPVNSNLVTATQVDLRRLNLLAHLYEDAEEGAEVDPAPAAAALAVSFPALPGTLREDLTALQASGLVAGLDDTSLGGAPTVAVTPTGRQAVESARAQIASDPDARHAAVGLLVLSFLLTHGHQEVATEPMRAAGVTVLAEPLPDDSVEAAVLELDELGLINAQVTWGGAVIPLGITAEGRICLRSSRPVLLADVSTPSAPIYNTTVGTITSGAVAIGANGDVHQDVIVNVDQATANLRIALESLYEDLPDDMRSQVDDVVAKIDEAEDTGSKSLLARAAAQARRLANLVTTKGIETATTVTVTTAATALMGLMGSN